MNGWLVRLLKYLSLIAVFTLFIPFVSVGHFLVVGKTDNAAILLFTLLTAAVGCFGGLASYVAFRLQTKIPHVLLNVIRILVGLSVSAAAALVATDNIFISVILFFTCSTSFFMVGPKFLLVYSDILSKSVFAFAIVSNLIICFFIWAVASYFSRSYTLSLLAPTFLVFTIIYFLSLNQANIDDLMIRRHHKLSQLPLKIRYYNVFLTLSVLSLVVIGYLLRGSIAKLVAWVGGYIRTLFKWFFSLILWLMSFGRKGDSVALPPAGMGNDSGVFETAEGSSSWNILYLVFAIAVVFFLVFYRKEIFSAISQKLRTFFDFIKRQLSKLTVIKNLAQSSDEYVDTVESLSADVKAGQTDDVEKVTLKRWKKSHQKFIKMDDSVEKLRYGYGLILRGLTLSGVEIAPSDTTLEIIRKANNSIALDSTTSSYNDVRYGDLQPNVDDINHVEDTLSRLRTSITNKNPEPKRRK